MYFVGNMRRREDIRRFWYFDCQCPRCSDPTELGSYMSAVICFACKLGFLVPTDSLQYKSDWKCDSCGNLQSYDLVNEVISTIESQVSNWKFYMYEIDLCIFCKTNSYFSFYSFLGIAVLPATAVLQWVSIIFDANFNWFLRNWSQKLYLHVEFYLKVSWFRKAFFIPNSFYRLEQESL